MLNHKPVSLMSLLSQFLAEKKNQKQISARLHSLLNKGIVLGTLAGEGGSFLDPRQGKQRGCWRAYGQSRLGNGPGGLAGKVFLVEWQKQRIKRVLVFTNKQIREAGA